jgi:DNA-binding transcriptional MerR regulator
MAYEPRIASALSGATRSQLDYWRRQELLVPEVSATRPVLFSFRDLIALRTFVYLREQRPLQTIRRLLAEVGRP